MQTSKTQLKVHRAKKLLSKLDQKVHFSGIKKEYERQQKRDIDV